MKDGIRTVKGHDFLIITTGDKVWVSCLTCDQVLARRTKEPRRIVFLHITGKHEGSKPGTTLVGMSDGTLK